MPREQKTITPLKSKSRTQIYKLDYICAKIIGLSLGDVPTLEESFKRGFIPEDVHDISCNINVDDVCINDFELIKNHRPLPFTDQSKLLGRLAKKYMTARPDVNKIECVGCEKCKNVCPMQAITMKDEKPVIDRKKCISCFCCQEFCPKGAMKVKRTFIARLLSK